MAVKYQDYQDLIIINWRTNTETIMRKIDIKSIAFSENEITINYVKNGNEKRLILSKYYYKIILD